MIIKAGLRLPAPNSDCSLTLSDRSFEVLQIQILHESAKFFGNIEQAYGPCSVLFIELFQAPSLPELFKTEGRWCGRHDLVTCLRQQFMCIQRYTRVEVQCNAHALSFYFQTNFV